MLYVKFQANPLARCLYREMIKNFFILTRSFFYNIVRYKIIYITFPKSPAYLDFADLPILRNCIVATE